MSVNAFEQMMEAYRVMCHYAEADSSEPQRQVTLRLKFKTSIEKFDAAYANWSAMVSQTQGF